MSLTYSYPYNKKIVSQLKKRQGMHQYEPEMTISNLSRNRKKRGGGDYVQPGATPYHSMPYYNSDEMNLIDKGYKLGYGRPELLSALLDASPYASSLISGSLKEVPQPMPLPEMQENQSKN